MNTLFKYGAVFLGGMILGAVAVSASSKEGQMNLKNIATDLIGRGMDLKDKMAARMEIAKENMEDLAAEARQAAEKRKAEAEASVSEQQA